MIKIEEFKEECLGQGDAKRIEGADRNREAERFENQSNYRIKAADCTLTRSSFSICF